jgi:hypothetical protein
MDLWPLLTEDLLTGTYSVERQLRPRTTAVAVRSDSVPDVRDVITDLCTRWGGAFSPLVSIVPGAAELDEKLAKVLLGSNIDGFEVRGLLPEEIGKRYSDRWSDATQWLLRQLTYLNYRPIVQTCRNVPVDHPWYTAYLSVFGDVPDLPDLDANRRNDLREDLSFKDFVDTNAVNGEPSLRDLLARLRAHDRISAVSLTSVRLPTSMGAGYNKGLPTTSRFNWGQSPVSTQYGPNLLVVYEPGSVADLALVWNLRARFAHPAKLPLAIPLTTTTRDDIAHMRRSPEGRHFFGFGHNLAITSFSVAAEELRSLSEGSSFDVVDPWDVFGEIYGCCVASTEMVHFVNGSATVSSFSPTDVEILGQSYLGTSHATWLTLTTLISKNRLPPSKTMRRTRWGDPGYLYGNIVHVGELDKFRTLRQPSGLEILRALALDHDLEARASTPGKAAENLMRTADADLSMFAYPGVTSLFDQLTRRGHASLVKRRLNQFLEGSDAIADSDKYETLVSRLDAALGSPELDEAAYLNFNGLTEALQLPGKPTAVWVDWAVNRRIILRGVEARCRNCKHAQWRPLGDAVPELECHGCGLVIDTPFGSHKIDYQYRASEVLLRAVEHDVLPSILAIRHISHLLDGFRDGTIVGVYPGIELLEIGTKNVIVEFDVVVLLTNGKWLVGECKARQRGLNNGELDKLWTAADRIGAPVTFAATLDPGDACTDVWGLTADSNGRPHFGLTAGHLYDLPTFPALYGEDLFGWREGLVRLPPDAEMTEDAFVAKSFGDYLLGRSDDPTKRWRAPWDSDK